MKNFNFFEKLWEHGRTLRRVGLVLVMCLITITQAWADSSKDYMFSGQRLYISCSGWLDDEAVIKINLYGTDGEFAKYIMASDFDRSNNLLYIDIDGQYKGFQIIRLNPNNLSQQWNHTAIIWADQRSDENQNCITPGYKIDNDGESTISWGSRSYSLTKNKIVYFVNNTTNWTQPHFRIGKTTYTNAYDMAREPGTKNLWTYKKTDSDWSGCTAFTITDGGGWTAANDVFNPNAVTNRTVFWYENISTDVTIVAGSRGGTVTNPSPSVDWYNATKTSGQLTYTVSWSTTNGTISVVKYKNDDGSSTSSISSGGTVLPTQYIKITSTPSSGYYQNGPLVVNNATRVSEGVYYVTGNCEISATYTAVPTAGIIYKFQVNTSSYNGSSLTSSKVNFAEPTTDWPMNTGNCLSTLIGGGLEVHNPDNKAQISNVGIYLSGNDAYLTVKLGRPICLGDNIKWTVATDAVYMATSTSKPGGTSYNTLSSGTLSMKVVEGSPFIGCSTIYLFRKNSTSISYFEIERGASITLNAHGGTGAPDAVYAFNKDKVVLPHAFKDGYHFKGWYTDASGGTKKDNYYEGTGSNVTFHAQYDDCISDGTLFSMALVSARKPGAVAYPPKSGSMNLLRYADIDGGAAWACNNSSGSDYGGVTTTPAIQSNNINAYVKVQLDCALESGDQITINGLASNSVWLSNSTTRPGSAPSGTTATVAVPTITCDGSNLTGKTFYVYYGGGSATYTGITITRPAAPSCSTPAAPTISGTTAYTYGGTITLEASHTGSNHDASTTYRWLKGAAFGSAEEVQAALTGLSGYTFTTTAAIADAGTYWCEASNGEDCKSHNSSGYAITVAKADLPGTASTGTASSITYNSATLPYTISNVTGVASVTIKVYEGGTLRKTYDGQSAVASGSCSATGLSASTTYTYTVTLIGDANHNDKAETAKSTSFTTSATPTLTAISAGVVYDADEMIPYGQTVTNEDIIFNNESYSTGNLFYTNAGSKGPKANTKNKPGVTIGEGEDYEASFNTNMMYIKGSATLSGTPKTPGAPSIKFKIPAGGGTLYLYGPTNTTAKFIKEDDTEGTAIANTNQYISVSVDGGDICYIYGSSEDNSGFYGLKLVAAPSTYTISYECYSATSGCPSEASEQTALPNPLPNAPTKNGYTFGGWYTDNTLETSAVAGATLDADATLYAKWAAKSYTLTLDKNHSSASAAASTSSVDYDATSFTPTAPTYDGHSVDGYYTSANCTTLVATAAGALQASITVSETVWTNSSSEWKKDGASTLYAHWKCNTPEITDNGNNTVTITVPSGTTVRYTTDGTDPSSSSGTVYSTTFSIAADCTVKAIAYQTNCTDSEIASKACDYSAPATLYTVTFNTNGGSSQSSITQASEGASITMPSAPTKAGNTFVEWVIGSTTKAVGASYTPTANVTAYASWQNTCAGGGGGAASTTNVVATGYTSYQEKGGSNVIFTSAPSLGFKYKTLSGTTINSSTTSVTRSNAYSCQLSSNSSYIGSIKTNSSYSNVDSISFYFAGSAKSSCKVAVLYSTDNFATDSTTLLSATAIAGSGSNNEFYKKVLSLPPAKKANNLTFRFRFTTSSSGSTSYIDSLKIYTSAGGGGGTCYYVTYNGNGAATGFTSDTLAYNSSSSTVTVKANGAGGAAYAKSGYIFSGWNTKSDGTGTSFKAGDTFTISKDTILYAQWADPSSGDCFYIDDAKKKSDYSVTLGGTFDDTKLKGSITGGTVTNTSTESVSFSGNGKYGIIFDASTKKITVRLSSGTLKSGATIKIGGYTNNSKSQTCGFKVSGNNCSPASVSTTSGNSSYNFFTQIYTVSAADGVIGTDSFSITLVDDKTYLDSLYVSGCDDCTEGGLSYATASVTKTICDAAFTNTLSNSNSLTGITYSSTNTSVATVESDGEVTIVGAGTTTIKATAAAQSTYCASEATYSLTVNSGTAAGLSFATASYSKATDDEGFTQTVTNPNSLTGVTYSSSNPSVATVNETTGAVTLVSTGSTTITASTDAQTVSTTCYAAGSASYTISVSGSASCTTLPDYIWKTGSTYTPVGTSHTYADGDYNAIDNSASGTTHISISGTNYEQKSGSLNIGKSKDNYFLITAASGYVIDSVYFYAKMEDGECRMTTDNSSWDAYSAGQTTAKAFAIGVGTQYFGIKNKNTDSPKGVWIRTMRIKVCSASVKYTVTYNLNGHGDAISATTNITPNTTISAPSAPSADCYTFGGWYKEAGCTNAWTFASDKVTNNMTLYAKWTSNKAQVASTDYGKLVYTVTPAGTADALSVTPVDATGVTYKWLEYTSDDVSSASAVGGATSSSYSPSIASTGTKYYWAVLVHDCGNDTTDAFRIVVNAAKTDPTIVWGNVQLGGVNTDPTYGGGGYTLTGTINAGNASTPRLTTDMISAGEGVVITSKSVNDASKTFSLTFGLTAAFDTTQAKLTDIHFELPGNATYNDSLFATNLDYDKCSSGSASTDVYVVGYTNSTGTSQSSSPANKALKVANTWRSTSSPTFTDKTSADGFSISATTASGTYWAQGTQTFVASTTGATMKTYKLGNKSMTITWTNTSLSFSKVRIIGKNLGSAASTVSVSNGTTSENFTFAKSDAIQVKEVSLDFTYGDKKGVRFTTTDAKELNVLIELVPTGSDGAGTGTTTTLEWKSGYAPSDISDWDGTAEKIVKEQADANFSVVAQQTSATNSLGAITYSSNNEEVATVNSTTGEVDIVAGASGGEATITAEMARSGCYKKATLSYIINVPAQACDIEAGSIAATSSSTISVSNGTATKCSTEAVTLTISGHTTSGTTVTWWKDGSQVTHDGDNYTIDGTTLATKVAGIYNAKVTGATCAVATNNIKVVNRSASVSVTKLVNQWYIKNGRVTPDIPLFELGEGCSFVGAKADDEDLSDELGGCTVYQKDGSNIVYLQGKAPSGMTVGNVSLQIVVEDVCGNTGTSAAITIHKQVATDKHELAFVVAGTDYNKKTFTEDAWTDGIQASQSTGLALYQVLKDTFKILATNIYASDSIQQIREYYSQFDLICITDYPNTGTKGKHGRSYVDAIGGAMIDVRPLLTMEAYVSGLNNWRAKGVIGSRTTPSKRQYNMMLQCKDHEIFDGTTLKQFGYGDDALFQVNIVDSTAHRYTDLDATSKSTHASDTAALQGFTIGEMLDLLPLGTTDNGSGTDLQVGVERQKVMTARMMVLGINSYAMERLSKDGKQIVVNALQYLTKKRSEDISDCSSYFTNADGDNEWGNPLNWRSGTVPTSNQEARITQPVTISDTRKIASIKIATDGTFQDADVDGSITITSTGTLIVTGKVQSVKSPDFMNGFATSAEDVTIEADDDSQGALILNNEDGTTMATVEMYSKAGYEDDGVTPNFAYVGAPVSGMTLGSAFSGAEIWYYDESNPYWWSRCDDSEASNANFLTYCISHWEPQKFTLSGTLAPTGTQNFTLSVHSGGVEGDNMIANSWTAPIDIAQFETSDFDGAEATLYMYRTGHDEVRGTGEEGSGAGKWASVSVDAAKSYVWPAELRMIPSMQAFCIEVDGTHTLTMDYDRLVRANAYTYENGEEHAAILAPKRRMAKANRVDPAEVEGLRLVVSGETTGYDVYLFAHPGFSENFDNGWDARHMEGGELSNPLLCVPSELGNLDIAAIPELAGRVLKFVPSSEREYTFSMTYEGENELYLNDIKKATSTRIQTGNTYDFLWENGDGYNRFMISAIPFAPQTPTGVTNLDAQTPKAQKFIYKDKMFIIRGGKVFSADGQLVK